MSNVHRIERPKRLTGETIVAVRRWHHGKRIAFTPIIQQGGIGLGIAVANEPGCYPTKAYLFLADTWDEAQDAADEANAALGLSNIEAAEIIMSSMRAGPLPKS